MRGTHLPGAGRWTWLALVCVVVAAACAPPRARHSDLRRFDADRVADAELGMWKAYYGGARVRLFVLLVETLRTQYDLSCLEAIRPSLHFAAAAARFYRLRGGYERVLPELEEGYREVGELGEQTFDPVQVAHAELGWWIARRTPGKSDPRLVGEAIAKLYAAAYQVPEARVETAGLLRAEAASVRDEGAAGKGDLYWREVSRLLHASYAALHRGVAPSSS